MEKLIQDIPIQSRYILGLSGIPGSGKSTFANTLSQCLNQHYNSQISIVLPMDGFHFSKAVLSGMPNPKEAFERRGAPFTFDGHGLLNLLIQIKREPLRISLAPSFDHAIGDPIPHDLQILPSHKVVVVEGLYLTLNVDPWNQIYELFDETWFLQVPLDVAFGRLVNRHLKAGLCHSIQEAEKRTKENDLKNAEYILLHSLTPNKILNNCYLILT